MILKVEGGIAGSSNTVQPWMDALLQTNEEEEEEEEINNNIICGSQASFIFFIFFHFRSCVFNFTLIQLRALTGLPLLFNSSMELSLFQCQNVANIAKLKFEL